ncbi:(d)CMP kinase, partial [Candidatus Woesebacteria bacterium]|nr:(d)CMP kinase [Candidatus Woesebacteria bacterium]
MSQSERLSTVFVCCDGMAAVGKGTLLDHLHKEHDFVCLSSGFLYRAITSWALSRGIDLEYPDKFQQIIDELQIRLMVDAAGVLNIELSSDSQVSCFTIDDTKTILRNPEIDAVISFVSASAALQEKVDQAIMQLIPEYTSIVLDGRDTYRFINAIAAYSGDISVITFALYLYAQTEVLQQRAEQRLIQQAAERGELVTETMLAEEAGAVVTRNEKDFTRESGRLLRPEEAAAADVYDLVLDTSHITAAEVA